MSQPDPTAPSRPPALAALSYVLWFIALAIGGISVWQYFTTANQNILWTALALATALLIFAASWGIYQQKRWGVVLFGALAFIGSANHLSNVIVQFASAATGDPTTAVIAIIRVLGGVLIPIALIYVTVLLWKQSS